jgi:ribulose-5-phosphate 4-epimerase/fuculose-1-phosphate aldolase
MDKPNVPSLRDRVSKEEWAARVALAATYRLVAHFKWDDLVFTHISARLPGPEHHFLINPYGFLFDEITASSLIKVDLGGKKISESPCEINPAGFVIHSAIHAARDDAKCVLHIHSLAGIAVSVQKHGLLPLSQQSLFVLSSLARHGYEGVALRDEEKPRLVADLGDRTFLMLPNDGLITVGKDPAEAFLAMYIFESACRIQVMAERAGGDLIKIADPILAGAQKMAKEVTRGLGADLIWPGLLRRLDKIDPSYKE